MTRSVDEAGAPDARRSRKPFAVALPMVALIVAFDLLREHGGHVAGLWPYLLLACPLMHLVHGHGRHGRHGSHAGHGPDRGAGGG